MTPSALQNESENHQPRKTGHRSLCQRKIVPEKKDQRQPLEEKQKGVTQSQ